MKKMIYFVLASALVITVGQSCKKKMSDDDAKKAIEAKFATMTPPPAVAVKDGTVTLTGNCKDATALASLAGIVTEVSKDLKLDNKCVVALPQSVTTTLDAATMKAVTDGMKDIKGVTTTFANGKAVLAGAVTKETRMKIMQMLTAAKVQADVTKLMDAK